MRQLTAGHGQYLATEFRNHGGEGRVSSIAREQREQGVRS